MYQMRARARKLRGIYFIDPTDEEFKETIKNARKKLKFRCQQPCLARSGEASTGKLVALLALARQNTHASWKTMIHEKAFGRNST